MKTVLKSALLAGLFLSATPAWAARGVCINTQDIRNTEQQDNGKALLFTMRDGTQWRNTLQGACPDLKFDGYVWTVRNPDGTVCENAQTLRVLQSGEICALGKFEKVAPAHRNG